jgi:hypothetical protein
MGEPPSDPGAVHVTAAPPFLLVTFTMTGAPGTVAGATGVAFTAPDGLLGPVVFAAVTQK